MPSPALRKLEVEANAAFDQVSCDDYDAIGYCTVICNVVYVNS